MHTAMETYKFGNQAEFLKWKEEEKASSHTCFVQQHEVSYHHKGSAVDDSEGCSSGKHLHLNILHTYDHMTTFYMQNQLALQRTFVAEMAKGEVMRNVL